MLHWPDILANECARWIVWRGETLCRIGGIFFWGFVTPNAGRCLASHSHRSPGDNSIVCHSPGRCNRKYPYLKMVEVSGLKGRERTRELRQSGHAATPIRKRKRGK